MIIKRNRSFKIKFQSFYSYRTTGKEPNELTKIGIEDSRKKRAILERYSSGKELFEDLDNEL